MLLKWENWCNQTAISLSSRGNKEENLKCKLKWKSFVVDNLLLLLASSDYSCLKCDWKKSMEICCCRYLTSESKSLSSHSKIFYRLWRNCKKKARQLWKSFGLAILRGGWFIKNKAAAAQLDSSDEHEQWSPIKRLATKMCIIPVVEKSIMPFEISISDQFFFVACERITTKGINEKKDPRP